MAKRRRINSAIFDTWSKEMAYLLGYFTARAHIAESCFDKTREDFTIHLYEWAEKAYKGLIKNNILNLNVR